MILILSLIVLQEPEEILRDYASGKFTPAKLAEAARRLLPPLTSPDDVERAEALASRVEALKVEEASRALREEARARFEAPGRLTPELLKVLERVGRRGRFLQPPALDAWIRLDDAAADRYLFETTLPALGGLPPAEGLWFFVDVVAEAALARDPARARKAVDAWIEGPGRKIPDRMSSSTDLIYPGGPVFSKILDVGASKDVYKRLAGHPRVAFTSGFIYRWLETRRGTVDLTDEDRVDILLAANAQPIRIMNHRMFVPLLGPSFASDGEPLRRALARYFAGFSTKNQGQENWKPFYAPAVMRLGDDDLRELFKASADNAAARLNLRGALFDVPRLHPEKRPAIARALPEILGKDAAEDEHWLGMLGGVPAPDELIAALNREGLPPTTVLSGVKLFGFAAGERLLPGIERALAAPGSIEPLLRALTVVPKERLEPLAPALVETYARADVEARGLLRRDLISASKRGDLAPRLVAIVKAMPEGEPRKEAVAIIAGGLKDKRVVKALIDIVPPGLPEHNPWVFALNGLCDATLGRGETLEAFFERVRAKLPPQVAPITEPLGKTEVEPKALALAPPKAPAEPPKPPTPPLPPTAGMVNAGSAKPAPARGAAKSGPPGALLYSLRDAKRAGGPVATGDDLLFLGDKSGLQVIDLRNGETLESGLYAGTESPGIHDAGDVVLVTGQGAAACYDKRDGARRWTSRTSLSCLKAVGGGGVVVASGLGAVAFDAASGKTLWSKPAKNLSGSHALYADKDGVLLQGQDGLAWADPVTGVARWTSPPPDGAKDAHYAIRAGAALLVGRGKDGYEIDLRTGRELYRSKERYVRRLSPNYRVLMGSPGLEILDAGTGATAWTAPDAALAYGEPGLCLLRRGSRLTRVDEATGKERWTYGGIDAVKWAMAEDGQVVAHDLGTVAGVDAETGKERWRGGVPGFAAAGLRLAGGRMVAWGHVPWRIFAVAAKKLP